MDFLTDIAQWAWARHHNMASWYIRPVLLIPMCYFAWRRSLTGILLSFLALLSSMAWFPAPEHPDPRGAALLAAEKEYLLGSWPWWKIAITLAGAASLVMMCAAFWVRSVSLGLAVIVAIMAGKIAWTFAFTGANAAWALVPPALAGTAIVAAAVLVSARAISGR